MWERNRDQRWEMPSFFLFFFLKCMMWSENTSLRGSNDYFWAMKGSIPTRGPFLEINAG